MVDWLEMIVAFAVFFLTHLMPVFPKIKAACVARIGWRIYSSLYGIVSLFALAWVVIAAGRAPYVEVFPWAEWQLWVPNVVMPFSLWLAVMGVLSPNPLSFGGRNNERFDPKYPGIVGFVRHPLLWALVLWSASHALANPDLAHLILFGGFCGFAVLGMSSVDRRLRRQLGKAEWERLSCCTANIPRLGVLKRSRDLLNSNALFWIILFWLALLHMHGPVIGVLPYPVS